jgi:protease I
VQTPVGEVSVMRGWMLLTMLAALLASGCGGETGGPGSGGAGGGASPAAEEGAEGAIPDIAGKRIVMIVARRDFRDEELFEPRTILEEAGGEVIVASSSLEPAKGMLGGSVKPDLLVADVVAADYDAVVFVGGAGAKEYWNDGQAHAIARRAAEEGKVVAAICIAPVTLANAGVLEDRRATVWKSEGEQLMAKGARYAGRDLEVDGHIITADDPESAGKFGRAIARALGG